MCSGKVELRGWGRVGSGKLEPRSEHGKGEGVGKVGSLRWKAKKGWKV